MKKFIIAALAASVVAAPVLAAPYQGHDNRSRVEQRHDDRGRYTQRNDDRGRYDNRYDNRGRQMQYRKWSRGQRFDARQARNYRMIGNPRHYRLRDAPRGYRWVQSGNDAVLIGLTSGIVAAVIANMIR